MKDLLKNIEELIENIGKEELKKNSKASAKALEIKRMISELKKTVHINNPENQGVLNFVSSKMLLEN